VVYLRLFCSANHSIEPGCGTVWVAESARSFRHSGGSGLEVEFRSGRTVQFSADLSERRLRPASISSLTTSREPVELM
jgi:hypothetical protein